MDHLWDVSIVPVKDEAGSVQKDSQGTNSITFVTSRSELTYIKGAGIGSTQPATADHLVQAGLSSSKPVNHVADVKNGLSNSQGSQNQTPQPTAGSNAASSSREAVNNGHDHQSRAPGSSKQAEGMFISIPNIK